MREIEREGGRVKKSHAHTHAKARLPVCVWRPEQEASPTAKNGGESPPPNSQGEGGGALKVTRTILLRTILFHSEFVKGKMKRAGGGEAPARRRRREPRR